MAFLQETLPRGGFGEAIQAAFAEFKAAQSKRALMRQTFNELAALSNRELDDLGLSRFDLKRIARETVYGA